MGDTPHKMKVALVGGDRQGLELLSLLVRDSLTEVKLLVDPSPSALLFRFKEYGVDLADGGRCKLSQKVEDLSLFDDLSVVIDLKGGLVRQEILKVAPAGALVLDQKTTPLLWGMRLLRQRQGQQEFKQLLSDPAFFAERVKPLLDAIDLVYRPSNLHGIFLELVLLAVDGEHARISFEKLLPPFEYPPAPEKGGRVHEEAKVSLEVSIRSPVPASEHLGRLSIQKSFGESSFDDSDLALISKLSGFFSEHLRKMIQLVEMNLLSQVENLRREIRKVFTRESGDMTSKLDKVLDVLTRFLGSAQADLYLLDSDTQELVLQSSTGGSKKLAGQLRIRRDQGITGSILNDKAGFFLFGDSPRRTSAWREAYLPLRVGDYSVGVLVLQRGSVNGELLEGMVEGIAQFLAEQIGEETSKQQTSQALLKLSTLNEKGLKLLELREVDQIISASTTSAALLVGAEAAVLRLCDNGDWWVGGSFGIDEDGPLSEMILQVDESLVQDHVISSGTPVILNNLERFKDLPKEFPFKTFIGVPVKEGTQWVGVISLYNKLRYTPLAQPVFTQEDLEILNKYVIYLARAMSQARSLETFENLPGTDPLTGLKNERYFHVRLTEELERAARYDRKLGLVMVEVDYDKDAQILNGDLLREVVRRVSFMINDTFRNVDVVARMGENRFAVILPDTGDTLMEAITRLKKNASRFSFTNGHDEPIPLKFNVGWSYFPDMATNTRDLVSLASRLSPLQIASTDV